MILSLNFGKDENCSDLDKVRKNPQLVIAVKISSSFIGFFKTPLTPSFLNKFLTSFSPKALAEKINPMELVREAKEAGLLDSNVTTNCFHCHAIFPQEYLKCPQCGIQRIYHLKYK